METAERVSAELRELRQSIADLSRRMGRSGSRGIGRAADEIEDASYEALRAIKASAESLERRLGRMEKSARRTVQEHPRAVAGSLIGMALVGILLTMIFRRER